MSKALDQLRDGLYRTTLVQPLDFEGRGGSISVMCRQIPGQEKAWVKLVDALLLKAEAKGITVHVCRRYIRKDGRMAFGWFLGVEAKSALALIDAVKDLVGVLEGGPGFAKAVAEVEVPMPTKKYVSPYQDKTPKSVQDALDGDSVERSAATREHREFEVGPDPVAPKGARLPALKVISMGTDDKGMRTSVEEMPLPHTYKDSNKPKPGKTKGAYGGSGVGSGRPMGE